MLGATESTGMGKKGKEDEGFHLLIRYIKVVLHELMIKKGYLDHMIIRRSN